MTYVAGDLRDQLAYVGHDVVRAGLPVTLYPDVPLYSGDTVNTREGDDKNALVKRGLQSARKASPAQAKLYELG